MRRSAVALGLACAVSLLAVDSTASACCWCCKRTVSYGNVPPPPPPTYTVYCCDASTNYYYKWIGDCDAANLTAMKAKCGSGTAIAVPYDPQHSDHMVTKCSRDGRPVAPPGK